MADQPPTDPAIGLPIHRNGSEALRTPLQLISIVIGGGLIFGLLAWLSIDLTRGDGRFAAVWVPNAIAVAFLLRIRFSHEKTLLLAMWMANALANGFAGDGVNTALGLAASNTIEIALALALVRRWCGDRPDMLDIADLSRFVLMAAIVAPMVSATIAVFVLEADGILTPGSWLRWAFTDGLGMTIVAPSVMIGIDSWRNRRQPSRTEAFEWAAMLFVGTALTIAIFAQSGYPLLFMVGPVMIAHAFRLGALGTAFSVIKVAVIATVFTSLGTGPVNLVEGAMSEKLLVLQAFCATAFLIGLPVAATLKKRERIVEELDRGKHQLDLLASNVTDAIMRFDSEGLCIYASPSVGSVLQRDPSDFLGRKPSEKLHEDAREQIERVENALLDGTMDSERFTYRRLHDSEDGSPVFIEADCAVITDPATGARDGFVVSARDVTERVELELLLTRARRTAEKAARAKSEFLANMSHEIRTPMNGVLGFAELMLQSDLDEDQRRQTGMIVQSGRSMMLLLNDILDLSKIEAGQIAIDRTPIDLDEMMAECAALHRTNADKKGLELRVERQDPDAGPDDGWVVTDGLRVRQILLNLIGNAVKFTESGQVLLAYRIEEDQFTVEVTDTGIGIGQSRLDSIFTPFTQAESDTARRFGGTGLGLTICRQLADLLGGLIEVESEFGVGSCFRLTLPATRADPQLSSRPEPKPVALDDLPHDARILLAEDHDVNRMLATEMLERCGQRVAVAHDGNEAISMVIDSLMRGRPYDLVLMDIQMPGCDGYTAAQAIRAEGIGPDELPIIAITANAFPEDVAKARKAGMQGHLAKPLAFAELARALQRWLPTRIVESGPNGETNTASLQAFERSQSAESESHVPVQSPELLARWHERRAAAIAAVRGAVSDGSLGEKADGAKSRERLAGEVHKLAGIAAMFGEPELGEQAAALERSLRSDDPDEASEALAFELLGLADRDPHQEPALKRA